MTCLVSSEDGAIQLYHCFPPPSHHHYHHICLTSIQAVTSCLWPLTSLVLIRSDDPHAVNRTLGRSQLETICENVSPLGQNKHCHKPNEPRHFT